MYVANTHLKPVIGLDLHFVNLPYKNRANWRL
jgi:hypothetical protein